MTNNYNYHVCINGWDGYSLESAANRVGEEEAIENFIRRWDESFDDSWMELADSNLIELAIEHIQYVHMHETLEEAIDYATTYGNANTVILQINTEDYDIVYDYAEYKHPMTRENISVNDITVVDVKLIKNAA